MPAPIVNGRGDNFWKCLDDCFWKMAGFSTLKGSWPSLWHWIRSYCIPSCMTHLLLPTCLISFESKKLFVNGRTYVRMHGHLKPALLGRLRRWVDLKICSCDMAVYCMESNAPSFSNMAVNQESTRLVSDSPWVGFINSSSLQCFDTVSWVEGRTSVTLISILFWNKWKKKTKEELAYPCSPKRQTFKFGVVTQQTKYSSNA